MCFPILFSSFLFANRIKYSVSFGQFSRTNPKAKTHKNCFFSTQVCRILTVESFRDRFHRENSIFVPISYLKIDTSVGEGKQWFCVWISEQKRSLFISFFCGRFDFLERKIKSRQKMIS